MRHELKTWPEYFAEVWLGNKTFEIRGNIGRNFRKSDTVVLQEYNPEDNDFTGREISGTISYVTDFEQKKGFVVFQLVGLTLTE